MLCFCVCVCFVFSFYFVCFSYIDSYIDYVKVRLLSFVARTNLCYDLAKATKASDGKKNRGLVWFLLCI